MKIKKSKALVLLVAICLVVMISVFTVHVYLEANTDMWNIYCIALDSVMNMDEGLNSDMKYIAIDSESIKEMTPKDKERIFTYFNSKYNVPVIEASYEELKKDGKVNDGNSIDGVLLSVESKKIVFASVYLECSKYKSGLGAIGVKSIVSYAGINSWKLISSKMTWIS